MKALWGWQRGTRAAMALIVFTVLPLTQSVAGPRLGSHGNLAECPRLDAEEAAAQAAHDISREIAINREIGFIGCPRGPVCSQGIDNIATFLKTCPTDDADYNTIEQALPIYFDGTKVGSHTLATDVKAVCKSIKNSSAPAPTLRQQGEYLSAQALRTIYHMDKQGQSGCAYPWTHGASVYVWMSSLIAGIDMRDDTAYSDCCEPLGTSVLIAAKELPAGQYPGAYTWTGIASWITLLVHETRHAPGNVSPPDGVAYPHSRCCPAQQPGQPNSCDQSYQEGPTLSPYGTEYWLFRAWLNGTVNVGYSCMSPTNAQATTQYLQSSASDFTGNFCTNPPPAVSLPSNPGGTCPTH
jgi:hypothetical protein